MFCRYYSAPSYYSTEAPVYYTTTYAPAPTYYTTEATKYVKFLAINLCYLVLLLMNAIFRFRYYSAPTYYRTAAPYTTTTYAEPSYYAAAPSYYAEQSYYTPEAPK